MTTFDTPVRVRQPRTALVHRHLDAWLIGGVSIVLFALMFVVVPKDANISHVSWTAFYLAFLVNGPHFFASYWHMYVDNAPRLREPRFAFAAFVVPVLLVVGLVVASQRGNDKTLGYMVNLMYLSVGWHYVKQIFGVTLVSSAAHGRPIGGWPKRLLRTNLLTVWLMSWVFSNQYAWTSSGGFFGVSYSSANVSGFLSDNGFGILADHLRVVIYVVVAATALVALAEFGRKWIVTGTTMAPVGWVAWASIYVWYLPVLAHPSYTYFVPFFHSLQYLLFSVTFSWNKAVGVDGEAANAPLYDPRARERRRRQQFAQRFGLFVVFAVVLGAAGFHWVPEYLDRNASLRPSVLGGQFWVVAFNLFINIHHYFVDSVIWRGSNPQVRTFLRPRPVGSR